MKAPFALRARPHLLLAGLVAGLAASSFARLSPLEIAVSAGVLACAAVVLARGHRWLPLLVLLAAIGCWWGSVRLDALDHSRLIEHVGKAGRAEVVVTGPARSSRFNQRLPGSLKRWGLTRLSEPILLTLPVGRSPPQGTIVEVVGELRRPRPAKDGFDETEFLKRRGVHVVLRGGHWRIVGRRGGIGGLADRIRSRLVSSIAPGLTGERRAVLTGIVLGADEGLEESLQDDFRASGLYHLLAVSGQNVVLVAGGVLAIAWLLGLPRWLGHVGALAAIGGYVLAVGWQPSVIRAGVAGALASLAWLSARPRDRWYFLLLGALVLLAWNPYSLFEPGFQLSFAAVAAIFVAVPRLERRLEGYPLPRLLGGVLAVSVACGLATAPLLLLHFDSVPIYSVLANALAAPVVPVLLGLGFGSAALQPLAPEAAATLAWANGWLAAYLAASARLVASLPFAQVSALSPALLAAMLVVAVLAYRRFRWRLPRRASRLAVPAAVGLAAVAVAGWWLRQEAVELPPPRGFRMTVLDVGQGDSILLQVPEGAVLVDQGVPEAHVGSLLRRRGVKRLSLLVLTHPQRDHVGGAAEVLRRVDVRAALDPKLAVDGPEHREAVTEARKRRVPVLLARAGDSYRLGKLRLEILWPEDEGAPGQDPNELATVILASYGETDVVLTADAESDVTLPLKLPPVEVLKVAHHGSEDDGLPRLLELIRPQVAVISVGAGNDYGHPRGSTLEALESFPGLAVYRTDVDGDVRLESDGRRLSVSTGR